MFPWQEVIRLSVSGAAAAFFEPVFWMLVALIAYQYWQLQKSQKRMFGVCTFSLTQQVVLASMLGGVGGIVATFLLTLAGVNVEQLGLSYIWPVAILLMMIHMRFLCFAYAGGLVALAGAVLGWPVVEVPQVLMLVGILHITESLLIAMSGSYGCMPILLRHRNGQVTGAFTLQNFWPLPLLLMAAVATPESSIPQGVLNMPDWWPLVPVREMLPEGHTWMYALLPVVAALGYTDMAVASSPQKRRFLSALHLGIYSILLLILAFLSVRYTWLQAIAAFVSFVGHELVIQVDSRQELEAPPRFVPTAEGLMVLDTVVDTPARKAGIQPGDSILEINNRPIATREQLAEALFLAPAVFTIKFRREGCILVKKANFTKGHRMLGVIVVPEGNELYYVQLAEDRFWLWEKVKTVWKKHIG